MSYRKHLMTSDEPPSELYKAVELDTNLAEVGTDMISRAKAIEAIDEIESEIAEGLGFEYEKWRKYFCDLQPAQSERIKGHWIDTNIFFPNTCGQLVHEVYCDKCHGIAYFRRTNNAYVGASICPNCGADMREVTT